MFRAADGPNAHRDEAKIETSRYYDVVNFARRVTAPGLYSWGFNDETCPPTSMYSAYNVITAPKRLILAYDTGHRSTQEQVDDVHDWLADELTGRRTAVGGEMTELICGFRLQPEGCRWRRLIEHSRSLPAKAGSHR